jgi:beta-lactamase class A
MMERTRAKIEDAVTKWKRNNNGLIRIHIEGEESIQINSFIKQRAASTIKLLLAIETFRQIDEGLGFNICHSKNGKKHGWWNRRT